MRKRSCRIQYYPATSSQGPQNIMGQILFIDFMSLPKKEIVILLCEDIHLGNIYILYTSGGLATADLY